MPWPGRRPSSNLPSSPPPPFPLPTAPNPRSTRQLPHMSLHIHFHPSTLPPEFLHPRHPPEPGDTRPPDPRLPPLLTPSSPPRHPRHLASLPSRPLVLPTFSHIRPSSSPSPNPPTGNALACGWHTDPSAKTPTRPTPPSYPWRLSTTPSPSFNRRLKTRLIAARLTHTAFPDVHS